ncbi:unnamed protein product [Anisakis simplex]|uniref:EAL domain-containing protein n=1 Tax=Anisakis simplex TaxID=6269 RepID=A0A0M3KET3_ANISI|nr:unnamed protein product [Anisakis simplex]
MNPESLGAPYDLGLRKLAIWIRQFNVNNEPETEFHLFESIRLRLGFRMAAEFLNPPIATMSDVGYRWISTKYLMVPPPVAWAHITL